MYSDTPPRSDDPAITRALNDYIQREQLAINSTHAPFTRIPLRLPRLSSLDSSHHSILKDVSTKVTRTCVFCELNGDDAVKAADEEVDYSEGHFDCGSCLTKLTENLLKVENQAMLTYNACGAGQVLQVSSRVQSPGLSRVRSRISLAGRCFPFSSVGKDQCNE